MRLFLVLWLIFACQPAVAEIANCDGKWTNKPCGTQVAVRFAEKPTDPKFLNPDWPRKRDLVAGLNRLVSIVNSTGESLEPMALSSYCYDALTTFSGCNVRFQSYLSENAAAIRRAESEMGRRKLLAQIEESIAASKRAEQAANDAREAAEDAKDEASRASRNAQLARQSQLSAPQVESAVSDALDDFFH